MPSGRKSLDGGGERTCGPCTPAPRSLRLVTAAPWDPEPTSEDGDGTGAEELDELLVRGTLTHHELVEVERQTNEMAADMRAGVRWRDAWRAANRDTDDLGAEERPLLGPKPAGAMSVGLALVTPSQRQLGKAGDFGGAPARRKSRAGRVATGTAGLPDEPRESRQAARVASRGQVPRAPSTSPAQPAVVDQHDQEETTMTSSNNQERAREFLRRNPGSPSAAVGEALGITAGAADNTCRRAGAVKAKGYGGGWTLPDGATPQAPKKTLAQVARKPRPAPAAAPAPPAVPAASPMQAAIDALSEAIKQDFEQKMLALRLLAGKAP